jgi:hypothetical protein
VKVRPGTSSVTIQVATGSLGWCTVARVPTANGPGSSRSTRVTLAVQSGQCSTSAYVANTRSAVAATSMLSWNRMRPP